MKFNLLVFTSPCAICCNPAASGNHFDATGLGSDTNYYDTAWIYKGTLAAGTKEEAQR